jgi:hypothetical protein
MRLRCRDSGCASSHSVDSQPSSGLVSALSSGSTSSMKPEPRRDVQGPWFAGEHFSVIDAVFAPVFRYFDTPRVELVTFREAGYHPGTTTPLEEFPCAGVCYPRAWWC